MSTAVADLPIPTAANDNFDVVCPSDNRDLWLAHRGSGIGASEIASVLGESPWMSAVELYAIKIGAQADAFNSDAEHIYWGQKLEPAIIEGYRDRTGRPVERSGLLLRSRKEPWALCTLDGRTGLTRPEWPFEVKNAWAGKAEEWAEGPPNHYYLQVQHQLLVTGAAKATVACLIGGNRLVWCDVPRDEVVIRRITHAGRIFWSQCVEPGVAPRPDATDSATRGLCALYRDTENAIVRLAGDFELLFDELCELKETQKTLEKRRTQIENDFRAALGTAEHGLLPSRNAITWKPQRGGIDYKRCAEDLGASTDTIEKYRRPNVRVLRQHLAKDK